MFKKKKIFAYENGCGDKGIIIAKSYDDAEKIFREKYPKRRIINVMEGDDNYHYDVDGAYLFEMGKIKNNKLYNCFPW